MEPALIANIEFKRPKRPKLASSVSKNVQKEGRLATGNAVIQPEAEAKFLSNLKDVFPSAVVFSSILQKPTPCVQSQPVVQKLPFLLTSLHKVPYNKMTPEELNAECQVIFQTKLVVSKDEASYLEQVTRLQSQSILWHQHRTGRVTASKIFAVARTSIENPSRSLIKEMMETKVHAHTEVLSLKWGIENEQNVREQYFGQIKDDHTELSCTLSGLCVNPKYPHLGATPDGIVKCDCCGNGLIEIKCPYKHKESHPHSVVDNKFCLEHVDGLVRLKKTHEYYYQIQGQLAICEMVYCDFVCWTPHGIHIERILPDTLFETVKPALDTFFVRVLLPLLMTGKTQQEQGTAHVSGKEDTYCWCNGKDEGAMVACDNENCTRQWFHFECVGLKSKPRGKWYCCAECRHAET